MTREEAVADLVETFGSVRELPLPAEPAFALVVINEKQFIPNNSQATRVALKLPAIIGDRPQVFVEAAITMASGGQPANVSCQELAGELWKTWSYNTPWAAGRHSMSQLVHAILKRWGD
jgi:hypothetical protein